jgi:hypothetical protein
MPCQDALVRWGKRRVRHSFTDGHAVRVHCASLARLIPIKAVGMGGRGQSPQLFRKASAMFRISSYIREIATPTPMAPAPAARARGHLEPDPALQPDLQALLLHLHRQGFCRRAGYRGSLPGDGRAEGLPGAGADPLRGRTPAAARHLRDRRAGQGDGLLRGPVVQRHADRRAQHRRASPPPTSTTWVSASTASAIPTTVSAASTGPSTAPWPACAAAAIWA